MKTFILISMVILIGCEGAKFPTHIGDIDYHPKLGLYCCNIQVRTESGNQCPSACAYRTRLGSQSTSYNADSTGLIHIGFTNFGSEQPTWLYENVTVYKDTVDKTIIWEGDIPFKKGIEYPDPFEVVFPN
jgi:hypothetical protein